LCEPGTTYGSFEDESMMILEALVDILSRGDYQRSAFTFPKLNIHLTRESVKKDVMERILQLTTTRRTPYFTLDRVYLPKMLSHHSSAYLMPNVADNLQENIFNNYVRGGCMQAVSLNLPQMAYEVNGSDEKLFELLEFWIKKARDILLLKVNLMENNLQSGLLSFLSQKVSFEGGSERYFEPSRQNLVIGFVGLNEMVKAHKGVDLSDTSGSEFGFRFIDKMSLMVKNLSEVSGLNFVLAATPSGPFSSRMAQTDVMNHPKAVVNGEGERVYYT